MTTESLRDKMRRKGIMPTPEDIKNFNGPPIKYGTKVLVTPVQSARMKLDRVRASVPWEGFIVGVFLTCPAYEIYRFKDSRKIGEATLKEVIADGFMEPYIDAATVKIYDPV